MLIKSIFIGNTMEAFLENKFSEEFNILYSDDNNKGKTIVIQSILYCMGNNPVFPSSFNYEEYYFILTLESNGEFFDICRRKNNFVIKKDQEIYVFDNLSEFKNYWNKNIQKLPIIVKDSKVGLADLELLIQAFFTGQDKKITHDILNSGWLKKNDFYNMLYSMYGINNSFDAIESNDELKNRKSKLITEKNSLLKKNKILKKNNIAVETLSFTNKKIALDKKLKEIEKIKELISSLNSDINNAIKRKTKNELVLKELRSLNRTMKVGQISCMDCGSNHISYESAEAEFSFDISTSMMRSQIIKSIEEKIEIYREEIDHLSAEITIQQKKMNEILKTEEFSLEELLVAKINLNGTQNDDKRLSEIMKEIEIIDRKVESISSISKLNHEESKEVLKLIINEMNSFNEYIDSSITNLYTDIFTSRNRTYSGSEGTQFHLARMYAFSKVLAHDYPIVIDSFRAEDLSTEREQRVLEKFSELKNQIIFTTTLKEEENLKYESIKGVRPINYSAHQNYKILQQTFVCDFLEKLNSMSIQIKQDTNKKTI
ncbi:hypothetical protein KQ873_02875 [Mycoplasma zalophidermidis]|uniref:hypothetical protein n=1 Tax=Mycoplasma zalophidermidis TaxID=398174 RepID=UPI001C0FA840|nr:hypothetical protein [Mycoplasma zalophidermidis]MBU4689967.1 hypothetical protein [Mycoplasma zalophidermidis]